MVTVKITLIMTQFRDEEMFEEAWGMGGNIHIALMTGLSSLFAKGVDRLERTKRGLISYEIVKDGS